MPCSMSTRGKELTSGSFRGHHIIAIIVLIYNIARVTSELLEGFDRTQIRNFFNRLVLTAKKKYVPYESVSPLKSV